jgi:protein disulfide-isomerase-like protein
VNTVEHVNGEVPGLDAALAPYVQELTDDTIDAYVNDADYDVLVEFYAPWCGHCKQFEPFYREVGVHFAGSDVRVAKIDVDAYRAAATRYDVRGLPSVQLFPKGYKTRGLQFTGAERKPASIIAFVKSPQVYLVESSVGDMKEWECVVWLESKGVLRRGVVTELVGLMGPDDAGQGGGAGPFVADAGNSTAHDAAAREMFKEAHGWSSRGRWLETMEILVCLAHTTPLRRTGIGSSPGMWNFLDNAKMHVEDPSLGGGEGDAAEYGPSTDAEAAALNAAAEGRRMNPDGEDWDAFGGADGAMEEREATGFDWEAWEAFASRDVGDAYAGGGRDEL